MYLDSSDAVSKNPKASDNLESIEKELSELTNYVAQIGTDLSSNLHRISIRIDHISARSSINDW